jgi:hypothetical protein
MRELPRHNLTRSRARVNPEDGLVTVTDEGRVVLSVTTIRRNRPRTDHSFVERIVCRDLANSLMKCDPSVDGTDNEEVAYGVNLSRGSCDCKGWVRWGTCKHLAAAGRAFPLTGASCRVDSVSRARGRLPYPAGENAGVARRDRGGRGGPRPRISEPISVLPHSW